VLSNEFQWFQGFLVIQSEIKWNQAKQNGIKWNKVTPGETKWNKVK